MRRLRCPGRSLSILICLPLQVTLIEPLLVSLHSRRICSAVCLFVLVFCAALAHSHEIPADVQLKIFVKPEGKILRVLVRVPMEAMRDFEFAQRPGGHLDLVRVEPQLADAARLWLASDIGFFEEERPLGSPALRAVRVALPSDRAFDDYDQALQAVRSERLPSATELFWEQALLDVEFEYAINSAASRFHVLPTLARLGLKTLTQVRFINASGDVRSFAYIGDPGLVSLDPAATEVVRLFVVNGFTHVLDGVDHLLFLFALLIPLRRIRPLIVIVTAFTLAHSITLAASLFGLAPGALWFPPLIEMLIAGSIVYMALENLLAPVLARRWLIAFAFGLIHGFGFSFALSESLQFAGDHLTLSLFAFNVGIELGQLLVLVCVVPLLQLILRKLPQRASVIVLSAFVAHTGWHWLVERWEVLRVYRFTWPDWDLALLAGGLRWLMLLCVAALVVWLLRGAFDRFSQWGDLQEKL